MTNGRARARTSALLDTRRLVGVLVVVAVLSAVVLVGAVRGSIIQGEARALPVGSAPGIGDCLTDNPHAAGVDPFGWTPYLPSFELRPCNGPRFGEVVRVEADFAAANATSEWAQNPYQRCTTQADRYLGIPPRPVADTGTSIPPGPPDLSFFPTANVTVAFFGPDARQRAAGQRWAACVILLPTSVLNEGPVTVSHSLQGAWLRVDDVHLFSLCLAGPTSQVALNCNWPHRIEMIGMAGGDPEVPQLSIDTACREAVVRAIGSPAALAAGTVTAVVVPVRPNPSNDGGLVSGPDAVTADSPYFNMCLVRATDNEGKLAAPLRGLGNAPVPVR